MSLTAGEERLVVFWRALFEVLDRSGSRRRRPRAKPEGFQKKSLGRSEVAMCVRLVPGDARVDVFVVLMGENAKPRFHALLADREAIDRDLGLAPTWDEKPDRKESHIRVTHACDFEQPATWEPTVTWVADTLNRFDRVFRVRVREL